jgi:DNA repair exonuclease SbcCD ATPase subunit
MPDTDSDLRALADIRARHHECAGVTDCAGRAEYGSSELAEDWETTENLLTALDAAGAQLGQANQRASEALENRDGILLSCQAAVEQERADTREITDLQAALLQQANADAEQERAKVAALLPLVTHGAFEHRGEPCPVCEVVGDGSDLSQAAADLLAREQAKGAAAERARLRDEMKMWAPTDVLALLEPLTDDRMSTRSSTGERNPTGDEATT